MAESPRQHRWRCTLHPVIRRSWREGGGSHWPPQYEPLVEPWPSLDNECWTPTRPGAAITACLRSSENEMQLIDWGSVEQAIEAAEQLFTGSCGSGCRGDHLMLWTDTESVHTARIGPPQPPLPLADELAACCPTQLNHTTLSTTPAFWPAPSILNGPIPR